MPIIFACPMCGKLILVSSSYSGSMLPCDHCRALIAVPEKTLLAQREAAAAPSVKPRKLWLIGALLLALGLAIIGSFAFGQ